MPSWLTMKVLPAMVMVPLRWPGFGLAATANPTVPLPMPLLPDLTVIKEELLTAVQAQLAPEEVTLTLAVPPPTGKFLPGGLMLKELTASVTGFDRSPPHELDTIKS